MVFTDQTRAYPEDAEAWRDLATSAVASNDLPRAEQAADRLVALLSSDAAGYTLRGIVAERNGRFDEAVRWHRLAVVRAPKSIESLVALGLALQYAGKSKEGLEIMAEALKLDPNSSIARRAFAVAEAE
jgi:tetratricopeptide (TPR) repeat protein